VFWPDEPSPPDPAQAAATTTAVAATIMTDSRAERVGAIGPTVIDRS
jgi:hypothetical protein